MMTDNEIIKALECCPDTNHCELCDCKECCPNDFEELMKLALDIINRQKAEIDRLYYVALRDNQRKAEKEGEEKHALCVLDDLYTESIKENKELKAKIEEQKAKIEEKNTLLKLQATLIDKLNKYIEKIKHKTVKEFAERVNKEAENIWIDREGDFLCSDSDNTAFEIYDTVAEWCKEITNKILKEMAGDGK